MVHVWFKVIVLLLYSYTAYLRENNTFFFFILFSEDILICNPRGMHIGYFFKRNSLQMLVPISGKSSVSWLHTVAAVQVLTSMQNQHSRGSCP